MTTLAGRPAARMGQPSIASPYLGNFERLWSQRTITLAPEREGREAPSFGGSGSEPQAGGSAFLPLTVRATYVDRALITEGFQTFGKLASMSAEEEEKFVSAYGKARAANDSIFVWAELRTSATEDYLKLDRWTFYIANENGRQFEPGRILEHPIRKEPAGAIASKAIELYFPKIAIVSGGQDSTASHTLRFVMLEAKNPAARVEGSWQISQAGEVSNPR